MRQTNVCAHTNAYGCIYIQAIFLACNLLLSLHAVAGQRISAFADELRHNLTIMTFLLQNCVRSNARHRLVLLVNVDVVCARVTRLHIDISRSIGPVATWAFTVFMWAYSPYTRALVSADMSMWWCTKIAIKFDYIYDSISPVGIGCGSMWWSSRHIECGKYIQTKGIWVSITVLR